MTHTVYGTAFIYDSAQLVKDTAESTQFTQEI